MRLHATTSSTRAPPIAAARRLPSKGSAAAAAAEARPELLLQRRRHRSSAAPSKLARCVCNITRVGVCASVCVFAEVAARRRATGARRHSAPTCVCSCAGQRTRRSQAQNKNTGPSFHVCLFSSGQSKTPGRCASPLGFFSEAVAAPKRARSRLLQEQRHRAIDRSPLLASF